MSRLRAIAVGIGGGIVLSTCLTAALEADAITCCDPWGAVGSAAFVTSGTGVVSAITAALSEVTLVIETTVNRNWSSGIGQVLQEAAKRGAAQKLYPDGRLAAKTQLYLQEKQGEALEATVEAAAFDETMTSALMVGDQALTVGKALREYGRIHADELVLDRSQAPGRSLEVANRHARWANAAAGMEFADIDVASVITPESNMTYSDEARQAAMDYVRNVVHADSLYYQVDASTPQGRAADALTLADQAALSAAAYSLNAMMAERTRRGETESN